jgi:hypothetical protein
MRAQNFRVQLTRNNEPAPGGHRPGAKTAHLRLPAGHEILRGGIRETACEVSGGVAGQLLLPLGSKGAGTRAYARFLHGFSMRLAMLLRVNVVLLLS